MSPLFLAALLSGGGALYNSKMQNDAIVAQNEQNKLAVDRASAAKEAERRRQERWEQEQFDAIDRTLREVDPGKRAADIEAATAAPENEIVQSAEDYNIPSLTGQNATGSVASEIGKIVADRLEQTKELLRAQSVLSEQGVGSMQSRNTINRMNADIGAISRDRSGSIGVNDMETSIDAATVTPSDSPIGDILLVGGQLAGGLGSLAGGAPLSTAGTSAMVTPSAAAGSIYGAPLVLPSGLPPVY